MATCAILVIVTTGNIQSIKIPNFDSSLIYIMTVNETKYIITEPVINLVAEGKEKVKVVISEWPSGQEILRTVIKWHQQN